MLRGKFLPEFNKWLLQKIFITNMLMQENNEGIDQSVFFKKIKNKHQRIYSTIQKECFALLSALQHFYVYLNITVKLIMVFADNNPFTFIHYLMMMMMNDKYQKYHWFGLAWYYQWLSRWNKTDELRWDASSLTKSFYLLPFCKFCLGFPL